MVLKFVGASLIFTACVLLGFRAAKGFRQRPRELQVLQQVVRLLQAEVEFHQSPIYEAFHRVGGRIPKPFQSALIQAAADCKEAGALPHAALKARLGEVTDVNLRAGDVAILVSLTESMGVMDREHLASQFDAAEKQYGEVYAEAKELQRKNERLWQYAGILTGLLLVILLY